MLVAMLWAMHPLEMRLCYEVKCAGVDRDLWEKGRAWRASSPSEHPTHLVINLNNPHITHMEHVVVPDILAGIYHSPRAREVYLGDGTHPYDELPSLPSVCPLSLTHGSFVAPPGWRRWPVCRDRIPLLAWYFSQQACVDAHPRG